MLRSSSAVFHALIGIYVRREPGRTLLTLAGVALGVAMLVAIRLAIDSAVASFKDSLADVAGRATITVRGNTAAIPAALTGRIAAQPGVQSVAPLIEGSAILPGGDGATTRSLLVLGVDLLRAGESGDSDVRDVHYRIEPGRELTSFLTDPGAAMFTDRLARQAGFRLGETVSVLIDGEPRRFTVGALIDGGALAETLAGGVMIVDLGIADVLFGRGGRLDQIDLTTGDGDDVEQVMTGLRRLLPPSVEVERPERRGRQVDAMLAAFRFNLQALGWLALLVGAFLIYNTMSVAVVRRAEAIGTLRALGVGRAVVRAVFLLEGVLFGLIGGAIGVAVGVALAERLLGVVGVAIAINYVPVEARRLALDPVFLACALGLGVAVAAAAALGPAGEAAATAPANTMRRGMIRERRRPLRRNAGLGVAALAVAGAICWRVRAALEAGTGDRWIAAGTIPWGGYLATLLTLVAFVLWSRPLLLAAVVALRRPLARLLGAEGLLAAAGTRGAIGRAGVAIGGLLVALGMTVSVVVMVDSFRATVVGWMQQVLRADLYLSARPMGSTRRGGTMPAAIADAVARIPGVAAVDPFRMRAVTILGRPTHLGGGRFDIVRYGEGMRIVDGRLGNDVFLAARRNGAVIVSEAFARKTGRGRGDRVPIPTPGGNVELPIEGVYYDYSTEQGYVIMDRSLYEKFFPDARLDSLAIYLAPGADAREVRAAVERAVASTPGMPATDVRANTDLRRFALTAFNRTFRITYVIELIAILISMLGVTNTLLSQILDRRDEILTLRTLGMTRGRVARVVVIESGLIGLVGTLLGVAVGLLLSWILTRVIMLQSFGWTIFYQVPAWPVAQVAAAVFVSTLLAGLLPARQATRLRDVSRREIGA